MPDWTPPLSAQTNDTVTFVLFQPFAFGSGVRLPVITGFVRSIRTVTVVCGLTLPALSVHVPATSVPAVSPVTFEPVVQKSMPLGPMSPLLLKLTATGELLCQPLALAVGLSCPVGALGADLSMLTSPSVCDVELPA